MGRMLAVFLYGPVLDQQKEVSLFLKGTVLLAPARLVFLFIKDWAKIAKPND